MSMSVSMSMGHKVSMSIDDESDDVSEIESDDVPVVSNDLAEQSDDTMSSIISVQRVNFSLHIVICIIDFDIVLFFCLSSLSKLHSFQVDMFMPQEFFPLCICGCRLEQARYKFLS